MLGDKQEQQKNEAHCLVTQTQKHQETKVLLGYPQLIVVDTNKRLCVPVPKAPGAEGQTWYIPVTFSNVLCQPERAGRLQDTDSDREQVLTLQPNKPKGPTRGVQLTGWVYAPKSVITNSNNHPVLRWMSNY